LTEICQRAAKLAIREDINRSMERDRVQEEARLEGIDPMEAVEADLVPEIMPRHFEEAVRNARRSVSDNDLAQYSRFASTLQQSRANITTGGGSLAGFTFPQAAPQAGAAGALGAADDEEDLYS